MSKYIPGKQSSWIGRASGKKQYMHEKAACISLENSDLSAIIKPNAYALLGYAGEEGVRRNKGRVGAAEGPDAIKASLAKLANHLPKKVQVLDAGTVACEGEAMEDAHQAVAAKVSQLLQASAFPILLGGGHDLAYAHYLGLKDFLGKKAGRPKLGIINLDAHFDLRALEEGRGHSGSPFLQIAEDLGEDRFHYLCLGIQECSNIPQLFQTAQKWNAQYLLNTEYSLHNWNVIEARLAYFIDSVDHIYLTVDLDGFHSGIAPGVSAASPFGFDWAVAQKTLQYIIASGKLLSADIVELNPNYDVSGVTARLAAGVAVELMKR